MSKIPNSFSLTYSKSQLSLMSHHHLWNYILLIMKTLLEVIDNCRLYKCTIYQIHILIAWQTKYSLSRSQEIEPQQVYLNF